MIKEDTNVEDLDAIVKKEMLSYLTVYNLHMTLSLIEINSKESGVELNRKNLVKGIMQSWETRFKNILAEENGTIPDSLLEKINKSMEKCIVELYLMLGIVKNE